MMKTMRAALAAGLGAVCAAAVAADAEAQSKVRWKMHSAFGSKLPIVGTGGVRVAETITELSEGRFEVKFYEPGALLPGLQYYDAVGQGSVDAAWTGAAFSVNKNPAYAFFSAVPFGPGAGEYLAWMRYGGGLELQNELYAKDNLISYPCNMVAPEASGWFRKEIKSIEDLRGMKMRFLGLGARVMEKFGVSTQLLAPGDIYPALELGTIDATEFSMPVMDEGLGFHQVAKHYYFPGWHQQSTIVELVANKKAHDALSPLHQKIIRVTCDYQTLYSFVEGDATQFGTLKRMQEKGVTLHIWPQEVLDKFRKAWEEVIAEETAKSADMKRIYESYSKFRADYAIWKEAGYLK
jgi:TRAP-type mannitol/chloroaromatic compound transport system substrate-binding protein